ncbi:hypothetical protein [Actinoplanes sp. NPDC051494]|uniref:hypothetical protein n=1 Tax=Actinoplanes sp. NPDC051494 TaxID=3363907 RepID=UPI0037A117BE
MSDRRRQVVAGAATVVVSVGVGIATNVVSDAPHRVGWIVGLVVLTGTAAVIEIGTRLSKHTADPEPEHARPAHGGAAYAAGRDNRIDNRTGMSTGQLFAVIGGIVLVVALLAAVLVIRERGGGDTGGSDSSTLPRTPVPAELVGTWSGGTDGATANWSYTFSSDGDAEQANGRIGVLRAGTVVISGEKLTLHFPDRAPQTFRWRIDPVDTGFGYGFSDLQLDGLSYVRQDAEPAG